MSYRDEFILVSNDSKVTMQMYNAKTLEPSFDKITETNLTREKVYLVTNKVLLSATGYMDAGKVVEKELYKRVSPDNDLAECADILQNLIFELKAGLIHDLSEKETNSIRFLKGDSGFTCNLFGFFHDGMTGIVDYNITESDIGFDISKSSMVKGYPAIIQSPEPEKDRGNFNKYLSLPKEEQKLDNFVNQFVTIHAHLSSIYKGVSTDCNFHVLHNDGNTINYYKHTVETEEFYDDLGLTKDMK